VGEKTTPETCENKWKICGKKIEEVVGGLGGL